MVRVSRLIEQLSASGVIVFVVSHDFEFIVRTCTEVVQLRPGGRSKSPAHAADIESSVGTVFSLMGGCKSCFKRYLNTRGRIKRASTRHSGSAGQRFDGRPAFVLAYQVIAPLVMGAELDASFLICGWFGVGVPGLAGSSLWLGLNLSHKAAYDTLLRLRTALQKRFEKLPLGVIQDKGTGTVKKLFVDDVDSLEVLLAHSMPEGIANLMVPIAVYVAMFFVDWKLALLSLASIPISLIAMMTMYSVGMKKMGPYYMAGQKMNNTIIEYINGMEVVKVFNKDADSYERFRKDVSDYRDYTLAWYKAAWPWMAIYSSSCLAL